MSREKTSRLEGAGGVSNLYNASVNVSYALDVFGGNKRQLEGLQALADYQQYQLEAAYLALTANLVTTAIREASLRGQLQATGEVLDEMTAGANSRQRALGDELARKERESQAARVALQKAREEA